MEGLLKAMQSLDQIVATIRAAKDGSAAAAKLQQQFGLSPEQVLALYAIQDALHAAAHPVLHACMHLQHFNTVNLCIAVKDGSMSGI